LTGKLVGGAIELNWKARSKRDKDQAGLETRTTLEASNFSGFVGDGSNMMHWTIVG